MSNRNRVKKKKKLEAERLRNALYELRDAGLISLSEGEKSYEVELTDPGAVVGYGYPQSQFCSFPKHKIKIS